MTDVLQRQIPSFHGRILGLRQVEHEGSLMGEADILVAVYGVPDTNPAVGNEVRQVIDRGAFRTFLEKVGDSPRQFYRDHGNAHITGFVDSSLLIGYADSFRDTEEGLVFTGHYNLATKEGREAYERVRFRPDVTQFSFRWTNDTVEKGEDGFEHVVDFEDIEEVSQVGFGAQALTRPLVVRSAGVREAIPPHSTATSEGPWDAGEAEANLAADASAATLASAYAWRDPDGDPETKAAYRFIHHEVSSSGEVGPANLIACSNGIGVLNGGRGGTTIPDADREGVYNHLARHLRDGGREPPELRGQGGARATSLDVIVNSVRETWWALHRQDTSTWVEEVWTEDESLANGFIILFHERTGEWSRVPWARAEDGTVTFDDGSSEAVVKVWQTPQGEQMSGVRGDREAILRQWLQDDEFRATVEGLLRHRREEQEQTAAARAALRDLYEVIYSRPLPRIR